MKYILFIPIAFICLIQPINAQLNNANHIAFPPTPNPPLAITHYTRAAQTISLQCNSNAAFQYGLTSMSTSGFLNLSISPYPNFVSSSYLGSSINPRSNACGTIPNLDISKPVGETIGQFNVSMNGAATYEIPIQISPGTRQIQPNLSISYNSQGGLGLLGIGWSLNGLSSISRSNKIPLIDGKYAAPLLNQSDIFALDGNRLYASNGIYGSSNTNYYTENESFATISSLGSLGNGPEKFEIQDKNGNIIQYGFTANSRLQGSGNSTAMSWYENKFTDEFGNYMEYQYKQLSGEIVIDEIKYTGNANAGLQTYNKISFNYIPLAESNTSFLNGAVFKQTQLLKEITCWAGTKIFKKYTFDYEWKEGTYLSMIKETDANGQELNPTFFCYENPDELRGVNTNTQSLNTNFTTNDYIDMINIPADFNADGFSDFACFNPSAGRLRIYQNNFLSTFNTNNNTIGFSKIFDNPLQVGANELMLSSSITDVNKDGKQELYCIFSPSMYLSNGSIYSDQYYVLKTSYDINNNVVVSNEGTYYTSNVFNLQTSPSPFMYNVQDYTGDGYNDQLKIDNESITLFNGMNTYTFALPNTINTIARPFNYDNDGIPEYIIYSYNATVLNCYFVKFNGTGFSAIPGSSFSIPFSNNGILQKNLLKHISFGDLNGDGIDDIVYMDEYNASLSVRYGTGLGFLPANQISCYTAMNVNSAFDISCNDLNADGKMDIMINEQIGTGNTTNYYAYLSFGDVILKGGSYQGNWQVGMATKIFYNSGSNLSDKRNTPYSESFKVNTSFEISNADFNGDGIFDYPNFGPGTDYLITNNVNGEVKQSLSKVYTPMRNNLEIKYTNLSTKFNFSNGIKQEVLKPVNVIANTIGLAQYAPNLYCVSQVTELSGFNGQFNKTKKYIYQNPIFHLLGKGFLGFEKINAIDVKTNIGTQITSSVNGQYFVPLQHRIISAKYGPSQVSGIPNAQTYTINLSKIITQKINTIVPTMVNSNSYFIQLQATENTDFLNSTRHKTSFSYNMNARGNIQQQHDAYGWNSSSPIRQSNTTFNYVLLNNVYRLVKENSAQAQMNQSSYVRETEYFYDNLGHLTQILKDNNIPALSNNVLNTTFSQFNAFGNPKVTTVSAPDVAARTSSIDYDNTGRFIIIKSNALGNSVQYTVEPNDGNIIEQREANGLITKYEYDGLGRLKKTIFPNNTIEKQTISWESPNNYNYATQSIGAYAVTQESDNSPYNKTYFIGNGLTIRKESQDFEGNVVISDNAYSSGISNLPDALLIESTEAHYIGQTKYGKTKNDYETNYFRPETVKSYTVNAGSETYTGHYSKTTYNQASNLSTYHFAFNETENQNGQKVKKTFNSAGQLFETINNTTGQNQVANYSYHSVGEISSISITSSLSPNQSAAHSFSYNAMGQKVNTTDPSHGNISYQYNSLGELTQITDANGTFNYTYDILGRTVSKSGTQSGTYTYQYITSGNGLGQLYKITGPNNVNEYSYDAFNNLLQSKESFPADNKVFISNFTYDNYGREITHTFPSGYITRNTYNALGYITSISDNNNQVLWELKKTDALNHFLEYNYGNGIVNKIKYNDLNQLEEIEHGALHKQYYAYDAISGNLNWRRFKNLITNTDNQEFFGLDANDRLTQSAQFDPINNTFQNINNISYDVMGNISHKDDAGDYHYTNTNNPFLLTQMSNLTNNVSLNTLSLNHNDFDKVNAINEMGTNKNMSFVYGNDEERIQSEYKVNGITQFKRYYAENFDRQESASGYKEWTYIFAPNGLCAIYYNNNGSSKLMYVNTDHLGSPILITGTVGTNPQAILEENSFDAWGRRRNPNDWSFNNLSSSHLIPRGFTFHEHIDEFSLINMNGRIYDGILGRFLQPDNFVQAPDNLQNYNRYAYAYNNPLFNKDPDGNFILAALGTYNLYFTNRGYQFQKNYSFVAVNVDASFGSEKRGLGINFSVGLPQAIGVSYRVHGGVGYYWKNNGITPGWETNYGSEWAVGAGWGGMSYSTTHYNSPGSKFDQTTGTIRFFSGSGGNLEYQNDWQPDIFNKLPLMLDADHGDRHRTAAMQLNTARLNIGFNLFTGDPGLDWKDRQTFSDPSFNNRMTYASNSQGNNPNEYRTGAAYAGMGPIKVGWNSEKIRHVIQNRFAHDKLQHGNSPWFQQLDIKPKLYFNIGSSGYGNGLY